MNRPLQIMQSTSVEPRCNKHRYIWRIIKSNELNRKIVPSIMLGFCYYTVKIGHFKGKRISIQAHVKSAFLLLRIRKHRIWCLLTLVIGKVGFLIRWKICCCELLNSDGAFCHKYAQLCTCLKSFWKLWSHLLELVGSHVESTCCPKSIQTCLKFRMYLLMMAVLVEAGGHLSGARTT